MRLSRPCYDKSHRCPGWAGGGWKFPKRENRCAGGYVTARRPWTTGRDEDYPGHPGEKRWSFGHCNKCDVVTWPVGLCHAIDPTWWQFSVERFLDRVKDSWRDYQEGEPVEWIWRARWRRYR